jgi:hypothetical protein
MTVPAFLIRSPAKVDRRARLRPRIPPKLLLGIRYFYRQEAIDRFLHSERSSKIQASESG